MRRWGLTARATEQRGHHAANACRTMLASIEDTRSSDNVRQVECWFPHLSVPRDCTVWTPCSALGVSSVGSGKADKTLGSWRLVSADWLRRGRVASQSSRVSPLAKSVLAPVRMRRANEEQDHIAHEATSAP